jgi:hypothetical protein
VFLPLRGVPTPVPSDRARRPWPDASAQSLRGRTRDHKAGTPPRMAVRGAHRARRDRAHGLHPAATPRTPLERKGAREPVPPPPTQWRGTGDRDAGRLAADTVAGHGLTALRRRRRAPHGDRRRGHGCPAGPVSWWSPGPSRSCLRSSGLSTLVAMGHAPVPMVVAWCATGVGNLSYVTVAVASRRWGAHARASVTPAHTQPPGACAAERCASETHTWPPTAVDGVSDAASHVAGAVHHPLGALGRPGCALRGAL